jgi:hypothetical protein
VLIFSAAVTVILSAGEAKMTHTINVKAAGSCFGFNQLADAVAACHSNSELGSDATTVVILKTSSLQPSSAELSMTAPTTSIVVLDKKCYGSSADAPAFVCHNRRQQTSIQVNVSVADRAVLATREGDKQQASFGDSSIRGKTFRPNSAGSGARTEEASAAVDGGASTDAVFPRTTVPTATVADDAGRSGKHAYRPLTSGQAGDRSWSVGKTPNCRAFVGCDGGRASATAVVVDEPRLNVSFCSTGKSDSCSATAAVRGQEERRRPEKLEVDRARNDGVSCDGAPITPSTGHGSKSTVKANLLASICRRRSKLVPTVSPLSEPKRATACNPFAFTTSRAPDATAFQFLCQSCQMVRFAAYWELRSHEDWCGRRNPSAVGMSCQKCGLRYKNLVLLHRHAVEVHASGNKDEVVSPDMHRAPTGANQFSFTTVGAPDARDFPHVCASCSTVCFRSNAEMRRHEDWCGRSAQNGSSFVCGTCNWAFHSDVLLNRHKRDCAAGGPTSDAGDAMNGNDDESPKCLGEVTKPRCDVTFAPGDSPQNRLASTSRHAPVQGFAVKQHARETHNQVPCGKRANRSPVRRPLCCARCNVPLNTRLELARHKRRCQKKVPETGVAVGALQASADGLKSKNSGAKHTKKSELAAADVAKKLNRKAMLKAIGAPSSGCVRCLDCGEQLETRLLLTRHKRNGTCGKSTNFRSSSCKVRGSGKMQKRAGELSANFQRSRGGKSRAGAKKSDRGNLTSTRTERLLEQNNKKVTVRSKKSSCKQVAKPLKKEKERVTADVKVQSCTVDTPPEMKSTVEICPLSALATEVKRENEVVNTRNDAGVAASCCLTVEALKLETDVNSSPSKTSEVDQSPVKDAREWKVELETAADVQSAVIGLSFDVQKTNMLRALDLIPVVGCSSNQNDSVVDRNASSPDSFLRRSGRCRKRKRIWTNTSYIDLLTPLDHPGSNVRVSHKAVAAKTSVRPDDDDIPRQRQTGDGKNGPVKAKKTERTKKNGTKNKNSITTSGNNQPKKSSLRTLETVNENALRCVACGIMLKTVRQIIAHVCRS